VVAGVDADHIVSTSEHLEHPADRMRVQPPAKPRILLAGQYVVRAVRGVAQEVVEALDQREPVVRLDLTELGDQIADGSGMTGGAGAQAGRAPQFVVVPGQYAAPAGRPDGGRRQHRRRRLVHAALRVGERDHPWATEVAPQVSYDLLVRPALRTGPPFQ